MNKIITAIHMLSTLKLSVDEMAQVELALRSTREVLEEVNMEREFAIDTSKYGR